MIFRFVGSLTLLLISTQSIAVTYYLSPLTAALRLPVQVVAHPTETGTLLVVEQAGRILRIRGGNADPTPFLDIKTKVISGSEMGLLSLAFPNSFKQSQKFYVNYTTSEDSQLKTVIAEFKVGSSEEKRLLTFKQPFINHNGGQLAFDAKDLLYIATGDGGSAGDPSGHGQNLKTFLGKILRIDPSKPDAKNHTAYSIPEDNPFAKGGGNPEIYAWGMRNPWRFSFDKVSGLLIAGDVGQYLYEEIDIIEKGGNYGWNVMEGKHCFKPEKDCNQTNLRLPIHEYGRDAGISITGGFVYRGKKLKDLTGTYIYGDYGSGTIWGLGLDFEKKAAKGNQILVQSHEPISSFGLDADGEILVVSHNGKVFRLEKR